MVHDSCQWSFIDLLKIIPSCRVDDHFVNQWPSCTYHGWSLVAPEEPHQIASQWLRAGHPRWWAPMGTRAMVADAWGWLTPWFWWYQSESSMIVDFDFDFDDFDFDDSIIDSNVKDHQPLPTIMTSTHNYEPLVKCSLAMNDPLVAINHPIQTIIVGCYPSSTALTVPWPWMSHPLSTKRYLALNDPSFNHHSAINRQGQWSINQKHPSAKAWLFNHYC